MCKSVPGLIWFIVYFSRDNPLIPLGPSPSPQGALDKQTKDPLGEAKKQRFAPLPERPCSGQGPLGRKSGSPDQPPLHASSPLGAVSTLTSEAALPNSRSLPGCRSAPFPAPGPPCGMTLPPPLSPVPAVHLPSLLFDPCSLCREIRGRHLFHLAPLDMIPFPHQPHQVPSAMDTPP